MAIELLVCSVVCAVIVAAVVGIRLYTRIILVAGLGSDDYSLAFGVLVWFAMMALFLLAPKYGLGRHLQDVDPKDSDMFMRVMVAAGTLYNTVMLACKLSILLLYRRLFPIQNFTKRWWFVTVFTVSYSVVIAVASAFGRTPVAAKWYIQSTGDRCPSKWAFYVANSVFNLVSDLFILILPVPVICNLSLQFRQKVTLLVLFGLGSATCIVSVVRLQAIIAFLKSDNGDVTWLTNKLALWCLIETTISIVCVCAPTLRPFFRRYFGSFFSWSGSGSNSAGNRYFGFRGTRYGTRSAWTAGNRSLPTFHGNHRRAAMMADLELGNPAKTDAHVEVGIAPIVPDSNTPPDYDARSTDHIIEEHKRDSDEGSSRSGISRIGVSRSGSRRGAEAGGRRGSVLDIHVQTSYEVTHEPA